MMRSACALVTAGACWPSGTMTVSVGLGVGLLASCGQESAEQPANSSAETATAGMTTNARSPVGDRRRVGGAGADHALVLALDGEVDRLGDRQRQTLAARAARAAGMADAEDVQEDADGHQDAAGDDERAGPRRRARDGQNADR